MNSKAVYKIPNGKLLKINLNYDKNTKIRHIRITGDFFAHPEESIELIEEELLNVKLDKIKLFETIQSFIDENKIELIGLDAEGLTNGILMCLK